MATTGAAAQSPARVTPSADMLAVFDSYNMTLKWKAVSAAADVAESGMFLYLRVRLAPTPQLHRMPLPANVSMMTIVGSGSTPHTAALTDEGGRANLVLSLWVAKLDARLTRSATDSVDNYEFAVKDNILMMRSDTKPVGVVRDLNSNMAMVARAEVTLSAGASHGPPYRVIYALQRRIDPTELNQQLENLRRTQATAPPPVVHHNPAPSVQPVYRSRGGGRGSGSYSSAAAAAAYQQQQQQMLQQQRGPPTLDRDDPDALYKNVYLHDEPDLLKMDMVWSVPVGQEEDPRSYLRTRTLPGSDYPPYGVWGAAHGGLRPDDTVVEATAPRPGLKPAVHEAMAKVAEFNAGLEARRMEMVEWRKEELMEKADPNEDDEDEDDSEDDSLG